LGVSPSARLISGHFRARWLSSPEIHPESVPLPAEFSLNRLLTRYWVRRLGGVTGMASFHNPSQVPAGTPQPFVIAWAARRAGMIEATMRACELPSTVDIAKRPGTAEQLSRLLDL